jgi:hypothetical protein
MQIIVLKGKVYRALPDAGDWGPEAWILVLIAKKIEI